MRHHRPLVAHTRTAVGAAVLGLIAGLVLPLFACAHDHGSLPNRMRVEPRVSLELGMSERGQLPLHVRTQNAKLARTAGYGVKVWVDGIHIYNNDNVTTAEHSFTLDLRKLGVGYHYILTNVCDHHDHVGASAMWIQITSDWRVIRYADAPAELTSMWREGETDWPGRLRRSQKPADPLVGDIWLNCCGEHNPWPLGANAKDFFRMHRR